MAIIIIVLVLVCGAFIYAGFCLMNGKDLPFGLSSGKKKTSVTPVSIKTSKDAIVTVRPADGKLEIIVDVDPYQISDNEPAPFDPDLEAEELEGGNDARRLFAADTPMEERRALYEELMETGAYVLAPFEQLFPASMEAQLPPEGSVCGPSEEIEGTGEAPEEQEPEAEEETEPETEEEEENDETSEGDGSAAEQEEEPEDNPVVAEIAERERQETLEGLLPPTEWDYSEADYRDNREAVLKAVSLMEFVADALGRKLIDPGLALFTQERLQLKAVDSVWNEEMKAMARESRMRFEASEPDIEELNRMVREDVERNSAEKDSPAPVADPEAAPKPKKSRPMTMKGSTTRIDVHGGHRDSSWDRLMED